MCKSRYLICSLANKLTSRKFTHGISTCIDFGRFPPNQNWRPIVIIYNIKLGSEIPQICFQSNAESNYSKLKKKETSNLEGRIP